MKSKISLILIIVFASCNSVTKKKSPTIQGIYITSYETEYSKARDTIEISPFNDEAGTFNYVRRTTYGRISNGVLGPPEHKIEVSTGVFNENTAQLNEQKRGRIYSLSRDGNQLVSGNAIYKRIH